jgi:hypothetical protein
MATLLLVSRWRSRTSVGGEEYKAFKTMKNVEGPLLPWSKKEAQSR